MTARTAPAFAPIYVKVIRAPEVFDVSVATIYRAKDRGEITIYKRGAGAYLKVAEVEAWIEGRTISAA
jgi:hypothetical protein